MLARIAFLITVLLTTTAYANSDESPLRGLQEATEKLISAVSSNHDRMQEDRGFLYQTVESIVLDQFDFRRMSGLALGKWWRRATPEERIRFEKEFTTLIIHTYGTVILEYTNQDILWKVGKRDKHGGVTVVATIVDSNGVTVEVKFKMSKSKRYDGYRVYDVSIEGVSIILGFRPIFSEKAKQVGVSGVIADLHKKNHGGSK